MTLRGLISPPRSRSSPRGGRPQNYAAGNPPSKPNYLSPSPFRRPTVGNPNEQRTHKKDNHATNVKASAIRTTKNNSAAHSPPRSRSSPKPSRPLINAPANPRIDASKPTTSIVPSRRPTAASNPNDLQGQKKLVDHSSSKMAGKTSYGAHSTRPSSPRTSIARNAVQDSAQQRMRRNNGVEPPPTSTVKPSQPLAATHSKNTVKGAIASGSKFDIPGANIAAAKNNANLISQKYYDSRNNSPKHLPSHGGQQVANISSPSNQNRYSGGHHSSIGDPEVNNQLEQLSTEQFTPKKIHRSIDGVVDNEGSVQSPEKRLAGSPSQTPFPGKDLANSTDELGSETEKEESSSQTHAPRIFQIYKDIASHRQGTLSITSYFTKLKTFWDELASHSDMPVCSCGAMAKLSEHGERDRVMQFLLGLDDSYSTICAQILLMKPFPTIEKTHSVILREEKRRELLFSLEIVAAKLKQNSWPQNDQFGSQANDYRLLSKAISEDEGDFFHSTLFNGDDRTEVDQNASDTMPASIYNPDVEVPSFPHEPLLIDLGSPLRC